MNALTAFRQLLTDSEAVTSQVGSRIFPGVSTSATYPQVVLTLVSVVPTKTLHERSYLDRVRIQASVYGKDYLEGAHLSEAIRQAVDNYSGESDGLPLNRVSFETAREVFEPGLEVYHNAIDFTLLINR